MLFSTPSVATFHFPYMAPATPRNDATGHGGRGRLQPNPFPLLRFFTPPSFGHLPYILLCKTPRSTTGYSRGGVVRFVQKFKQESTFHRKVRNVFVDK